MNEDEYERHISELKDILGSNWRTRPQVMTQYGKSWGQYQELERLYMENIESMHRAMARKVDQKLVEQLEIYSKADDSEKLAAMAGLSLSPKHSLENTTEMITHVHSSIDCEGFCTIHNRSDHPMRSWPQHWRNDTRTMERLCEHGVGHPDPDEKTKVIHGCDGCCAVVRSAAAVDIMELFLCPDCDFLGTELGVNEHRMAAKHFGGPNRKR